MFKEFKEFAIRGSALELAIGIVIGAAFNQVINSFVNDVLTPPLGLLTGHINFANLKIHLYNHTYLTYGVFLNNLINFLIVAFAVFLVVKQINRFRKTAPVEKDCPYCRSKIPIGAIRCPHCTSELNK